MTPDLLATNTPNRKKRKNNNKFQRCSQQKPSNKYSSYYPFREIKTIYTSKSNEDREPIMTRH